MRNGLVTALAVAGAIAFSGNAFCQADSTKQATKTPSAQTQTTNLRNDEWRINVDVGIGLRKSGFAYLGIGGVNYVEDTTTLPQNFEQSYGMGVRTVLGWPNSKTGGLNSVGLAGVIEKYFSKLGTPIRFILGGRIYNEDDPKEGIQTQAFGGIETNFETMGYDGNLGILFQKDGVNALFGIRMGL
jgi:hypothetical protein